MLPSTPAQPAAYQLHSAMRSVARQAASTPRQFFALLGLLLGMVSPPLLSSDWTTTEAMAHRVLAAPAALGRSPLLKRDTRCVRLVRGEGRGVSD